MRINNETFPAELMAAGIPLDGLSWDVAAGTIVMCPDALRDRVGAVLSAHDPAKGTVREATGSQIYAALDGLGQTTAWNDAVAAQKPSYRDYWTSGYRDPMPETNTKLGKIAKAAGVSLKAVYDAVGAAG